MFKAHWKAPADEVQFGFLEVTRASAPMHCRHPSTRPRAHIKRSVGQVASRSPCTSHRLARRRDCIQAFNRVPWEHQHHWVSCRCIVIYGGAGRPTVCSADEGMVWVDRVIEGEKELFTIL